MSTPEHRTKRAAFEPAEKLLKPLGYDPEMRRPIATVAGGALVLLRVVAGVLWMLGVTVQGPSWLAEIDADVDTVSLTSDEISAAITIILVVVGLALAVYLLLAVGILRGRNFPRVVVMFFSVVSISSTFAGWWVGGQDLRITSALLTLALDILILLALSSRSAAAYARRTEQ